MPTTNSNFSTLITAIDTKAQSLAASTTDAKDLVFLGKAIEALNIPSTVSAIIAEGDTQVGLVQAAAASIYPTGTTTSTSKTLVHNEFVLVDTATQTMTLPAGVAGQSIVYIAVGNFADTVVAPNGSEKIMGLAQSMTIDKVNTTITLMYHSAAHGWRAF